MPTICDAAINILLHRRVKYRDGNISYLDLLLLTAASSTSSKRFIIPAEALP